MELIGAFHLLLVKATKVLTSTLWVKGTDMLGALLIGHTHTTVNEMRGNVAVGGVKNAAAQIARFDLTIGKDNKITDARVQIVDNAGLLPTQYNEAYNLADYDALVAQAKANNLVVDGKASSIAATADDYYRLRDLATALKGTKAAFNVDWNGKGVINKGAEYTVDPLAAISGAANGEKQTITVQVDGKDVSISAVNYLNNYYVSADGLNALLGTNATQDGWVMTISTAGLGVAEAADHSH